MQSVFMCKVQSKEDLLISRNRIENKSIIKLLLVVIKILTSI